MNNQPVILQWILLAAMLCVAQSMRSQTLTNRSNLTVQTGAVVTVEGNLVNEAAGVLSLDGRLELEGNLVNNSSAPFSSGSGEVQLSGSSLQQLDGTNASRFYQLTQNNAAGTLLNQSISVENDLTFLAGSIDLNAQSINLGATGEIMGESGLNRIYGTTGSVEATRELNAPSGDNIAGMGLAISSSANLGLTSIVRSHAPMPVGTGSSIERSFDIQPTNNTNLEATLRIDYFDEELNGQNPTTLTQWRKANGAINWTPGLVSATGAGFVEGGPYEFMALWTLSADGTSAIGDQLSTLGVNIYPNPLRSGDQLSLDGLQQGTYQLSLFDLRGRKVWETRSTVSSVSTHQTYRLPALSEGMYTLQVQSSRHAPSSTLIQIQSN